MSAPTLDEGWLKQHVWPRFSRVLERDEIYLANHSLGRPPDRMAEDLRGAVDAWYRDLDGAWKLWLEGREKFRSLTARLLNAPRADSIIPKASDGQGLRAVLNALPGKPRIATSVGEFDSIDFILRVYREQDRLELKIMPWHEMTAAGADLVVLSTVMFRTGEVVRHLPRLIHEAHAARALVLLDVYHHAGVLPLDLAALEADFAIGGSYKYLRGGPGACWLYVRPGLVDSLRTPDTGWFAKKEVFKYLRPEPPQFGPGGDAWLESTPPVLGCFQALDLAARHVEAVAQMLIVREGALPALLGERDDEGQRRVVERVGRGAWHGARHVCDAVVHHVVHDVRRIGMRRRLRGLEAAA